MAYEYLGASLPLFFFGDPLPMSLAEFMARCAEHLSSRDLTTLTKLLEDRGDVDAAGFEGEWTARERQLRAAVAAARASRYGADPRAERRPHPGWDGMVERGVADAFAKANPLEREMELDRVRWRVLDELVPPGRFSAERIFAYGLKLRIAERWARMAEPEGRRILENQLRSIAGDETGGPMVAGELRGEST